MISRLPLVAVLALTATVRLASAQVAGGTLSGTVRDATGAVLPGASVVLTGSDRSEDAVSDEVGRFRFRNLAPGSYNVVVTLAGFEQAVRSGVLVRVGSTADLDMILGVGSLTEQLVVTAVRDTRSTHTSTNFTQSSLEGVPTSRDVFALLRAVPGVLVDRVNIAGNETGQQSNAVSKATRQFDSVWTIDGIVVTDMAAAGTSPLTFNFDDFEEVQVSTAGQDVRQPTGGLGVNLVVRRGTAQFRGGIKGYFTHAGLESVNLPAEMRASGVTEKTTDHNDQIADFGADLGGPLIADRLWFYGSYSYQDIRLIRSRLPDRTRIANPYVKLNWQASRRDLVSFLYYDGNKLKNGRTPAGSAGIVLPAATALQNQRNAYSDNPFHGLWKIEDNHQFGSVFATAKFAYFNTGFQLDPAGGLNTSSGRSVRLGRSFGSVNLAQNIRPQVSGAVDAAWSRPVRGIANDVSVGGGWRRVDATQRVLWPGNGLLALDNSLADRRVRVLREGRGTNRVETLHAFVTDALHLSRLTIEAGVRLDRQSGAALASSAAANPTFPELVPGITFDGFDLPFTWTTFSPRVGMTFAPDAHGRVVLRASVSRFAGQMPTALTSLYNPSTSVGFREYRWNDVNGDQLASADEVLLAQQIQVGGGFNPNAATTPRPLSTNQLGTVNPPRTTSAVGGVDVRLGADVTLQANYSYTRSTNVFGVTQTRVGVTLQDYLPGPGVRGTLPDGLTYDVATWIPSPTLVAAGQGGFVLNSWPGYYSDYHGVETTLVRPLKGRWMGRLSMAWNNAREHYSPEGRYDLFGNPTPTDTEPLVDGGQYAPLGGATNQVFMNARWQLTAEGLVELPRGVKASFSTFGRQGYPFVPFVPASLGADALNVLVTPRVDTYRLADVWNTDLRLARTFVLDRARVEVMADLFNVFNANTELVRVRNAAAPNYRQLVQILSPRIWRFGLRLGF